ncbi:MAG: class I SAM-dependent methyltransferase [Acidobacteria bacterium]|nr:MAG: class I SAM-dependent methyltransferase [Acidobacteriota bacterium]REK07647.1 MAG: class I SAM-dependent methyltransferase [Acidobacteriota bacterium]
MARAGSRPPWQFRAPTARGLVLVPALTPPLRDTAGSAILAQMSQPTASSGARPERPRQAHFRPPVDRRSRRKVKRSSALRLYHEVLRLEHLHYGLWAGEPLDLDGLRAAQQRYADRLQELIPTGVHEVLDVGSGTGAFSRQLAAAGYSVEGLSPDPYQAELYRDRVGRPFHLGRFQEFEPAHAYDLVLMSESSQYIWIDDLFAAVRHAVDDGHWLLADYFVVCDDGSRASRSGHPLDEFLRRAERAGFALEHREDITEATRPTLELGTRLVERFVERTATIGVDSLRERRPRTFSLLRRLFGGSLRRRLERLREEVDPEAFARVKRYEMLRFRVPPR